jgi:hypothetical protein
LDTPTWLTALSNRQVVEHYGAAINAKGPGYSAPGDRVVMLWIGVAYVVGGIVVLFVIWVWGPFLRHPRVLFAIAFVALVGGVLYLRYVSQFW